MLRYGFFRWSRSKKPDSRIYAVLRKTELVAFGIADFSVRTGGARVDTTEGPNNNTVQYTVRVRTRTLLLIRECE
jgi:hypothetical protein